MIPPSNPLLRLEVLIPFPYESLLWHHCTCLKLSLLLISLIFFYLKCHKCDYLTLNAHHELLWFKQRTYLQLLQIQLYSCLDEVNEYELKLLKLFPNLLGKMWYILDDYRERIWQLSQFMSTLLIVLWIQHQCLLHFALK